MTEANTPEGTGAISVDDAATRIAGLLDDPEPDTAPEEEGETTLAEPPEQEVEDEGDTDEAPAEPDAEQPQPEDDDPEIDLGDGEKVKRSELKKERLRQADYTRKTQELSEQRKAVQAEAGKIAQLTNYYAQEVERALQVATAFLPQPPDQSLEDTDPIEYARQERAYQRKVGEVQHLLSQREALQKQQAQHANAQMAQHLQAEQQRLLEAAPELKDTGKRQAFQKDMVDMLGSYGFQPAEIAQVMDHRLILLARELLNLRAGKAAAEKAVAKVKAAPPAAPKVVAPGTRPSAGERAYEQRAERVARLRKTGRVEDAAAAIADFL